MFTKCEQLFSFLECVILKWHRTVPANLKYNKIKKTIFIPTGKTLVNAALANEDK